MEGADLLTTFQVRVAKIFFRLKASKGFVVPGGAALLASALIDRPTQLRTSTCSHHFRDVRRGCKAVP